MTSTTTDTGETIELPEHCPPWCSGDHAQFCEENEGQLTAEEVLTHASYEIAHGLLDEIRDSFHPGEVVRAGGGKWELDIVQRPRDPRVNDYGHPLVDLAIYDFDDVTNRSRLAMTSGELRVLAAHAVAVADLVDGIGVQ